METKICKICGSTDYYERGRRCRPCTAKKAAKFYEDNKIRILENSSIYYSNNKEKVAVRGKKNRASTKDETNKNAREFRKNNPEIVRAKESKYKDCHTRKRLKYRAKKANSEGQLSKDLYEKLFKLQKGKCACCKVDLKKVKPNIDHINPVSKGGSNTDNNIQLLCAPCNQSKGAKHPVDFMQSRGFLI